MLLLAAPSQRACPNPWTMKCEGPLRKATYVTLTGGGGGASPRFGYATPPPPAPALRAHLVTKGQWLRAMHMVARRRPKILSPLLGTPENAGGR